MQQRLALLTLPEQPSPLADWRGQAQPHAVFLEHVTQVAAQLADTTYLINLCQDRYCFMVLFAAALLRQQISLLPPNCSPRDLAELSIAYPNCRRYTDTEVQAWLDRKTATDTTRPTNPQNVPQFAADQIAVIAFTSGSTGQPKKHPKTWASLVANAHLAQRRFAVTPDTSIIATVPPQHMYGLETSIMLPLHGPTRLHTGRPFFAADINTALAQQPAPRLLVTTPTHLRACINEPLDWPPLERIISATAPLSTELAQHAERCFGAPVFEIYGCTEGGSLASRRTQKGAIWTLYDGVQARFDEHHSRHIVWGCHLDQAVWLNDHLELNSSTTFRLQGRFEDHINIAGKRSSLALLNQRLLEIDGVIDGTFIIPPETAVRTTATHRLSAVVVAPTLSTQQVFSQLTGRIDAAFLPRPLYRVTALPRSATGKLSQQALTDLLSMLKQSQSTPV